MNSLTNEPIIMNNELISHYINNGGSVKVEYVSNGQILTSEGKLQLFGSGHSVTLLQEGGTFSTPILANSAIRKIVTDKGKILYENRLVKKAYDRNDCNDIRKKCGLPPLSLDMVER